MAIRQYIGARYVPKFMGTYDSTHIYEALDVVDNGQGTSYIAKIPTPAGTPLTNTTYWAIYGATSGAIINLQNQIDAIVNGRFYVTPQMFGAVGDGEEDDTQAFIDMLTTSKYIVIPKGTYRIKQPLTITSNTVIIGEGTIIDDRTTSGSNFEGLIGFNNADNILISGLIFQGRGAIVNPDWDGAYITGQNCDNVHINNVTCKDVDINYGICLLTATHSLIDYCTVDQFSYAGIANLDEGSYVTIDHCNVMDCYGEIDNNAYGIVIHSGNVRPITGHHFWCTNNYVRNVVKWEGIDAHGGEYIFCKNNYVEGCKQGIAIFRDDARTITCSHCDISENTIIGPWNGSLPDTAQLTGLLVGADYSVYRNNVIRNYGSLWGLNARPQCAPVDVRQTTGSVFEGNVLDNNVGVCMIFRSNVKNLLIKNNTFKNIIANPTATDGYYKYVMFFVSGDYSEVLICDNSFSDFDCVAENPNFTSGAGRIYLAYKNNTYDKQPIFVRPKNAVLEMIDTTSSITAYGNFGDITRLITSNNNIIEYMCTSSSTITPAGTGSVATWRSIRI